jgi:hypothetical protein
VLLLTLFASVVTVSTTVLAALEAPVATVLAVLLTVFTEFAVPVAIVFPVSVTVLDTLEAALFIQSSGPAEAAEGESTNPIAVAYSKPNFTLFFIDSESFDASDDLLPPQRIVDSPIV